MSPIAILAVVAALNFGTPTFQQSIDEQRVTYFVSQTYRNLTNMFGSLRNPNLITHLVGRSIAEKRVVTIAPVYLSARCLCLRVAILTP